MTTFHWWVSSSKSSKFIFFPMYYLCFFQEPFLHGVGVVAAARWSLLSEAKRLIPKTAQTTYSISATPDSMSISHSSQSLQPTCRHTLSSVQLSCGPQVWGGGHGNVISLMTRKDWTCSPSKNEKDPDPFEHGQCGKACWLNMYIYLIWGFCPTHLLLYRHSLSCEYKLDVTIKLT